MKFPTAKTILVRAARHSFTWKMAVSNAVASFCVLYLSNVYPTIAVALAVPILFVSLYLLFYASCLNQVFAYYYSYIRWGTQRWDGTKTLSLCLCAVPIYALLKGVIFAPGTVSFPFFISAISCYTVGHVRFWYQGLHWFAESRYGKPKKRIMPPEVKQAFAPLRKEWNFQLVDPG